MSYRVTFRHLDKHSSCNLVQHSERMDKRPIDNPFDAE
jgi:hypothetical protein